MIEVFDGHNDTLLALHFPERSGGRSFLTRSEGGHLDLPRALEAGLAGGIFAIFVPPERDPDHPDAPEPPGYPRPGQELPPDLPLPPPVDPAYARRLTEAILDDLERWQAGSGGRFEVVRSARALDACRARGALAAVVHFEGAEAIDRDLAALPGFYRRGLRSLGLVWSRPNAFGTGVPFRFPHSPDIGPGLTPAGRELVRACNRLGIVVDLAHLNERGFWDAAAVTSAPLVVSHAAAHALAPMSRNLTDRQLDAIGESGGLVGVNFGVGFLCRDGRFDPDLPLAAIADHVDHIAGRIGIEHVGFGSDFDGTVLPRALGGVSGLPALLDLLRRRGYDGPALARLAGENWIDLLRRTWRPAVLTAMPRIPPHGAE